MLQNLFNFFQTIKRRGFSLRLFKKQGCVSYEIEVKCSFAFLCFGVLIVCIFVVCLSFVRIGVVPHTIIGFCYFLNTWGTMIYVLTTF